MASPESIVLYHKKKPDSPLGVIDTSLDFDEDALS